MGLWGKIKKAAKKVAKAVKKVVEEVVEVVEEAAEKVAEAAKKIWKALVVVAVIAVAVLFVIPIVLAGVAVSITEEGFPVWGNYCGPGHGDDPQEKPAWDAVDEACMRHDKCYSDNYFGCDCDMQLLEELPAAIEEEAAKGNTDAVAAGEAILAYFSAQTLATCAVDLGRTIGGAVEDAWDAVT